MRHPQWWHPRGRSGRGARRRFESRARRRASAANTRGASCRRRVAWSAPPDTRRRRGRRRASRGRRRRRRWRRARRPRRVPRVCVGGVGRRPRGRARRRRGRGRRRNRRARRRRGEGPRGRRATRPRAKARGWGRNTRGWPRSSGPTRGRAPTRRRRRPRPGPPPPTPPLEDAFCSPRRSASRPRRPRPRTQPHPRRPNRRAPRPSLPSSRYVRRPRAHSRRKRPRAGSDDHESFSEARTVFPRRRHDDENFMRSLPHHATIPVCECWCSLQRLSSGRAASLAPFRVPLSLSPSLFSFCTGSRRARGWRHRRTHLRRAPCTPRHPPPPTRLRSTPRLPRRARGFFRARR